MRKTILSLISACLLLTGLVSAQESEASNAPVTAQLVAEHDALQAGDRSQVAVHVQLEEGWHVYWKNPGEGGLPTTVDWALPDGFAIEREIWSAPERLEKEGVLSFGYSREFVVLAELTVSQEFADGSAEIGATVTWLSCKDLCLPGQQSVSLSLPVGDQTLHNANWDALIGRHAETLPNTPNQVTATVHDSLLLLGMEEIDDAHEAYFFPDQEGLFAYDQPHELQVATSGLQLGVPLNGELKDAVRGTLVVTPKAGAAPQAFHVDVPLDAGYAVMGSRVALNKLLMTLMLAFLGGLILNLMPCVLPVISLKVFQFMNLAGSKRSHALRHGLVFTFGVVLSFWILAGLLLGLRAYGQSVGWGFQLQEPLFIVVLALVLFLLGLSLLGVFELGTSLTALGGQTQKKTGLMSSFLSGVLATVVATPCTGPLLAPALGVAVTLPPIIAMVVFTVLGLGMASPYLVLSAFPSLLRWLPKPGAWMVTFKQIMGFLMLATTLWLLWVFYAQVQAGNALIWLLAAMLILSVAAWVYGRFGTPVQSRRVRWVARLAAVAMLTFGATVGIRQIHAAQTELANPHTSDWVAWDADALAKLRAEGKPVFVDFTARWCLICQTNKVPIQSREVRETFAQHGVVKMEADWTSRDHAITRELERFGRSGVPLYVLYGPDPDSEPVILPQLLSSESLVQAVEQLVDGSQDH